MVLNTVSHAMRSDVNRVFRAMTEIILLDIKAGVTAECGGAASRMPMGTRAEIEMSRFILPDRDGRCVLG